MYVIRRRTDNTRTKKRQIDKHTGISVTDELYYIKTYRTHLTIDGKQLISFYE